MPKNKNGAHCTNSPERSRHSHLGNTHPVIHVDITPATGVAPLALTPGPCPDPLMATATTTNVAAVMTIVIVLLTLVRVYIICEQTRAKKAMCENVGQKKEKSVAETWGMQLFSKMFTEGAGKAGILPCERTTCGGGEEA